MRFSIVKKVLVFCFTGPSFKSSMYLFYIVILIISALMAADTYPYFVLSFLDDYLLSVRYGALILIAADKFMEQIFKDIKTDDGDDKHE